MMFASLSLFVVLLGITANAFDFNRLSVKPFLEPVNVNDIGTYRPTYEDDKYYENIAPNFFEINKRSADQVDQDALPIEEPEPNGDITFEKRIYINRQGFHPAKRSMAIGRAGMRPGKRAFAPSWNGGKRSASLSDNYYPLDRFFYFDE